MHAEFILIMLHDLNNPPSFVIPTGMIACLVLHIATVSYIERRNGTNMLTPCLSAMAQPLFHCMLSVVRELLPRMVKGEGAEGGRDCVPGWPAKQQHGGDGTCEGARNIPICKYSFVKSILIKRPSC